VWEDGLDRLGEVLEPVDEADEHVLDATLLELAQHFGKLQGSAL
jgi:hypothetical protein